MGGMQVLRRGGGEIVLSLITTQMVQGPFLLTDVRAHVGKHKPVIFRGDDKSLHWVFFFVYFQQEGQKPEASAHPHAICFAFQDVIRFGRSSG